MLKKFFFPLIIFFTLIGCANQPNILEISPKITIPQWDPSLTGVTITINGTDRRKNQVLAKITRDNQQITLAASRDLCFLLQEVLEKQMTARGYMIGPNGNVNLQVIVNNLYADVSQGNMRYKICTKADITIFASSKTGNNITKHYHAKYSTNGAFQVSNKNISRAVNSMMTDIISNMAQDTDVHSFIRKNAH